MKVRAVSLMGVAALLVLMLGVTLPAAAAKINFDSLAGTAFVPNGYGNTADVTVSYQTVDATGAPVGQLALFTPFVFNFYGDLDVVAFVNSGSGQPDLNGHYGEITLTPSAGHSVTFQSFDVASFVGTAPDHQLFAFLDEHGNVLTEFTDQTVGTSTHITYSPDITFNGPITFEFGPSGNIGINNIDFTSQAAVVPLPPSLLLFGSGLAGLMGFGRRLRRKA